MSEQNRNTLDRDSSLEKRDRKSISEAVRVSGWNSCQFEQALQGALPIPDHALWLRFTRPEEAVSDFRYGSNAEVTNGGSGQ